MNERLKMSKESVKKDKKKIDKVYVIAIMIPLILVIGLVAFIVLPNPIFAWIELKEARDFLDSTTDPVVVITDPKRNDSFFTDGEEILRDVDSKVFVEKLKSVMKNVKYNEITDENIGIWKIKIAVNSDSNECKIYIDENAVYLAKNDRLIEYSIMNSEKEAYQNFYKDIEKVLEK